jgi:hypothetical protein
VRVRVMVMVMVMVRQGVCCLMWVYEDRHTPYVTTFTFEHYLSWLSDGIQVSDVNVGDGGGDNGSDGDGDGDSDGDGGGGSHAVSNLNRR